MNNKTLFVIVGPTAVGKTAFSIQLAKQLKTEIISADSRQIYREMNIGTAKPGKHELESVKHHFINSHSINKEYNAGQYEREVELLIAQLFTQYDDLILVGGSGLYIQAALEGFDQIPEIPAEVRSGVVAQYNQFGLKWLQNELMSLDPAGFEHLEQQNPQRLMRALEVRLHTGNSIHDYRLRNKKNVPYKIIKIGLELERALLYKRIDDRMDQMIAKGLFREAESLYPMRHLQALQTVGYQEIFDFIEGKYDKEEATRLLKRNTRRYAKRQLTWFKRDQQIKWYSSLENAAILAAKVIIEKGTG